MTKMKKFLALLASLTAVATLGLATACGDKGDSSTPVDSIPPASTPGDSTPDDSTPVEKQYTVTVKKPDGTPAAGYWLQTCVGNNCSTPAQTDANGVFTFTFEEDATVYHVQATNGGGDDYANYEAVDFNTVPGTLTYEVTLVEKAPVVVSNTVAEVIAGENDAEFVLTGTVLANSGKGYVLADATGSIFVYGTTDANVGDIVKVTGTRATFGNCVQLKPTAVEAAEGTAIQAGAIKELTAADCDAYKAAQSMVPEYASFVGTLAVTENKGKTYYNITIDGTEVVGSLVTPTDADKAILADLNGKTVKVEGYVVYVTSGKYLYSVATNISEVVVEESITISEPIGGTGAYDDITLEYDYFQIETGKYYKASKEAQSAACSSIGYTLTSSVNGTYTLHIPESENENPVVVTVEGVVAELTDGSSFAVQANATVNVWVISSAEDPETWATTYFDAVFSLSFDANTYEPDGSELAPITVADGQTYTVGGWEGLWYTFTAPSAGQYKLTLSDWATQAESFKFFDAEYNMFNRGVAIDIAEGETVSFKAYSYLDNESAWTFSFGATLSNDENCDTVIDESIPGYTEENPLVIEAAGDYEITVLAGADFYAQFVGAGFQFVVPEGMSVQTLGMPSAYYEAGETVIYVGSPMNMFYQNLIISANAETTATLSVSAYVAPVVLDLVVGSNTIVLTEENYEAGVEYTFVAPVSGTYEFSNTGVFYQVTNATTSMPVGNHMAGPLPLEADTTYIFLIGSMGAGEYTLTIIAPEDGEEGGDEVGGSATDGVLEVGVAETITVTEGQTSEESGLGLTFTPTTYGKYSFKSDIMVVVYDDDFNPVTRNSDYSYTLNANVEYTIIVYYMPMMGTNAGTYSITVELKEELTVEEEDPTPTIPEDALTLPTDLVVEYTGGGQMGMIEYTIYVETAGTLSLTFNTADTWVIINNATAQVHYVFEKETYSLALDAAGAYQIFIGTWSEKPATMNVSVSFGDSSEGGDVSGDTDAIEGAIALHVLNGTGAKVYAGAWQASSKIATVADATSAVSYYMELAENGTSYYIYFLDADGVAQYLYLNNANMSASIASTADKTAAHTWTFDTENQRIVNDHWTARALYFHSDSCIRTTDISNTSAHWVWYEAL